MKLRVTGYRDDVGMMLAGRNRVVLGNEVCQRNGYMELVWIGVVLVGLQLLNVGSPQLQVLLSCRRKTQDAQH